MWYEVLPSVMLVATFVTISNIAFPICHYLEYGKPTPRYVKDTVDYSHFRRDAKLDPTLQGKALINRYFEDVPDLPEGDKTY